MLLRAIASSSYPGPILLDTADATLSVAEAISLTLSIPEPSASVPDPTGIEARRQALLQPSPWLEMFAIETPSSGTKYYTDFQDTSVKASPPDVTFDGNDYEARKITRGETGDSEDSPTEFDVSIEDPLRELVSLVRSESLDDQIITIYSIPFDFLATTSAASVETYRIRHVRVTTNPLTVHFHVGLPELEAIDIPRRRISRSRCGNDYHQRHVIDNPCRAYSDDFGQRTRQVLATDDGTWPAQHQRRKFGWFTQNADRADDWTTGSVTDGAYPGETFAFCKSTASIQWSGTSRNGIFMYRRMDGDFDVETVVRQLSTDRGLEMAGLMIERTDNNDVLFWGRARNSSPATVLRKREVISDTDSEVDFTDLSDGAEYFRIVRSDVSVYRLYVKPDEESAWVEKRTEVFLSSPQVLLGLVLASDNTASSTAVQAQFRYLKMLSGGLADCGRAFEDCQERENTHDFNGFRGIPIQVIRG